jgi:AraC-like DNA-binding protein
MSGSISSGRALPEPFIQARFSELPTELTPWVDCIFVNEPSSSSGACRFSRPPEGVVHIAFLITEASRTSEGRLRADSAKIAIGGPQLRRYEVPFPVHEAIVVRLRHGAAHPMLGVPAHVAADQIVDAEELWGRWARDAVEQIALERSMPRRSTTLLQFLKARIQGAPDVCMGKAAAIVNAHGGNLRSRKLAQVVGYSERQLLRKFQDVLGMRPKEFSRIARINRALREVGHAASWADLATTCGFFDQSHLIGEFQELLGGTPQQFVESLVEPRLLDHDVIAQSASDDRASESRTPLAAVLT